MLHFNPNGQLIEVKFHLTDRQTQVLALWLRHYTAKEIAQALHLSADTINSHCDVIRETIGAANKREVCAWAEQAGLIKFDERITGQ